MPKEEGHWITIEGRHIFIRKGESIDSAVKRTWGIDKDEDRKDKQIENNKKEADELNRREGKSKQGYKIPLTKDDVKKVIEHEQKKQPKTETKIEFKRPEPKDKKESGRSDGKIGQMYYGEPPKYIYNPEQRNISLPDKWDRYDTKKPEREKGEHEKEAEKQIRINAGKRLPPDPDDKEAVRAYREWYQKQDEENKKLLDEARRLDQEEADAKRRAENKAKREKYKDVDAKSRYKTSPNSLVYSDAKGTVYVNGQECAVERARMPLKEGGWKYVYRVAVPSDRKWNDYYDDSNSYYYGDTVGEAVDIAEDTHRKK